MKKLLLVGLLGVAALGLAGCPGQFPSSVSNPITQPDLYKAELLFDGTIKTFNELKSLCASRTLPSTCRTYVTKGQALIIKARDADLAAREFVDLNPTLDATTIIQTFASLVSSVVTNTTTLGALK